MRDSKKLVIMGCEWYPTDTDSSKGVFFKNHAEAISESKSISKVIVLCLSSSLKEFLKKGLFKIYDNKNIRSFHLNLPLGRFLKNNKLIYFSASFLYKLFIKKEFNKYDQSKLIFISQNVSGISCFFQKESSQINSRHIIIEHSTGLNKYLKEYSSILNKSLINSELYAVSKSLKKKLKSTYNVEAKETINNLSFYWTNISKKILKSENSFRSIKNILFVGHLIKRKNILSLIKAFIKIKDNNIRLTVVGSGKLEKLCKELSKNDFRIKFLKKIDNNLLPIIYQKHDLLILPSIEETFGVVMIEAASQGCQIASTISGGPEEIIKTINNGFLINGKETDDIYKFLNQVINTNYDRFSLIKNVLKNYSSEQFIKSLKL